jgi:hypothetical protein
MLADDFNAYKPWSGSSWRWTEYRKGNSRFRRWTPKHVYPGLFIRERANRAGIACFEVNFLNGKTFSTATLAAAQGYAEQWAHQQV